MLLVKLTKLFQLINIEKDLDVSSLNPENDLQNKKSKKGNQKNMRNEYNGWYNKQTWNINLMYSEVFTNMCEEQEFENVDHLAEAFGDIVAELEMEGLKEGSMSYTAVGEYLDRVNWEEIAEHYADDFDLFKEEEEEVCTE